MKTAASATLILWTVTLLSACEKPAEVDRSALASLLRSRAVAYQSELAEYDSLSNVITHAFADAADRVEREHGAADWPFVAYIKPSGFGAGSLVLYFHDPNERAVGIELSRYGTLFKLPTCIERATGVMLEPHRADGVELKEYEFWVLNPGVDRGSGGTIRHHDMLFQAGTRLRIVYVDGSLSPAIDVFNIAGYPLSVD